MRPLSIPEQGDLLHAMCRELVRVQLTLEQVAEHLGLPRIADEEVEAAMPPEAEPCPPRTGVTYFEIPEFVEPESPNEPVRRGLRSVDDYRSQEGHEPDDESGEPDRP